MALTFNNAMMSASYRGLSTLDAEVRTNQYGGNFRPGRRRKTWFQTLWGIVSEPMLVFLFITTIIYYFIGSHLETAIFGFSIIPIALIQYFQERRTDKAIQILDNLLVEECRVYRDAMLVKISIGDLVPGDLIYLSAGDKVPADGVVVNSAGFLVDESILTGESAPVVKNQFKAEMSDKFKLSQGTMVIQGEGEMVALATGGETQYGKLGNLIEKIDEQPTPLQLKVSKLVRQLATAAIITALFIGFVIGQSHGLLKGILGTLTIAMAIIPEEFPIVFSVFLIMGVWRLSNRQALVRKMVMVETLGSATVICTDKTGTLTEGKMSLDKVFFEGKIHEINKLKDLSIIAPLIKTSVLAMERVAIDPMEIEMQRFAKVKQIISDDFFSKYTLKKDSSFNADTKMVNHIWEVENTCFQYTAGAPENVINSCRFENDLAKSQVISAYEKMAEEGNRVVAIAKTEIIDCTDFKTNNLQFFGLIIMSDPPRYGVKEAIEVCDKAGIRVIMITGDHALTALAISKRVGLKNLGKVLEGKDLDALKPGQLRDLVREVNIFARIRPEQKYAIIEALQANEEIVAMTGDGVNDAPALKKATIGIAMGKKGTDVARAAAGIILLDDNFVTIVKAVEEGRRIYANLRKAFIFLVSFHIPIVGLAIIPILFGQELYFLPIHIIFLELFSDPSTVIGLERDPISKIGMTEKPRPLSEPLISPQHWWQIGWQSAGILGLTLAFYGYGLWIGNIALGRTMSFTALVIGQLIVIMMSRDISQIKNNHVLLWLVIFTALTLHVILLAPALRTLFHFVPLTSGLYLSTITAACLTMAYFNIIAVGKKKQVIPGR
ncbi:MAG: cation-translocating P-type ATPase [Patescibacteria group bacterium]|jgi:Ca2+-transporting ATPase